MDSLVVVSRLLDTAVRRGARGAEALLVEHTSLVMEHRHGRAGDVRQGTTVRVKASVYLADGRTGQLFLEVSAAEAARDLQARLDPLLDQALDQARAAAPDPLAGPADRYDLDERGRGLADRRLRSLRASDRREILEDNAAGCAGVSPAVKVEGLSYLETHLQRTFASTRGVAATEQSTRFAAECRARHGAGGRPYRQRVEARQFANVASVPFGLELGQRLLLLHRDAPLPPQPLPVIIAAPAVAELLGHLAPAFSAPLVLGGNAFVGPLLGRPFVSPLLHVIDDPGLPGGLESRAFDDHGVPPLPVVMIREGVAAGLFFDPYTARARSVPPTGHAVDGRVSPSNIVLRSGTRSRNAIGMEVRDYLVIEEFHGDRPLDLETGLLATSCDVVVWKNHEPAGTAREVPLVLPVRDLLGRVVEVAGDQARYGAVDACSLVLEGPVLDP